MKLRATAASDLRLRPAASQIVGLRNTNIVSSASARVGTFSTTQYLRAADATAPDLGQGKSLVLLYRYTGTPAGNAVVWGNCRNLGGWYLYFTTANQIRLVLRTNAGANSATTIATLSQAGLNCLALTHKSDATIRRSHNGLAASQLVASVTYSSNDATSQHWIGGVNSAIGSWPGTCVEVLGCAFINAELSDADLAAASAAQYATNRYQLTDAIKTHGSLAFEWSAYRDWDGSASTTTAGAGSNPPTFTVYGTPKPTRTTIEAESIYVEKSSWWNDTVEYKSTTSIGSTFNAKNAMARARFTTSATHLTLDVTNVNGALDSDLSTRISGNSAVAVYGPDQQQIRTFDVELAAGSKTIDVQEGTRGARPGSRVTAIRAIRVPVSTPLTAVSITRPDKRLVFICDDTASGYGLTTGRSAYSVPMLLRDDYPGGVTVDQSDSSSVNLFGDTAPHRAAAIAAWVAACDGATTNILWFALGTNDYSGNQWSAATMQSTFAAMLDSFHAQRPTATVYLQGPITRVNEANANGSGDNLAAYRTAFSNIASGTGADGLARSTWCNYVDGSGYVTYTGNYQADNIHPTATGLAQYKAAVKTALGY